MQSLLEAKLVDPKHSAHSSGYAGDAAYDLWALTKGKQWAFRALVRYVEFLEYYYKNPDSKLSPLVNRVNEKIVKLDAALR
ncbi:hypothetical protein HYX00_02930 [Candidatus Woesearchaeota archaeon]|nr:hypothetical protein [Candidatus Woesearchaeota archaeon]